jgi:murein DD-endopeptidase MepM/ murein hydrolase activator NlpD
MRNQDQVEKTKLDHAFIPDRKWIFWFCIYSVWLGLFIALNSACGPVLPGRRESFGVPRTPILTPLYTAEYKPAPGKENKAVDLAGSILNEGSVEKAGHTSNKNNPEMSESTGGFSLSGIVFLDMDANGIRSEGEPGIGSVRVCLRNPGGFACTPSGQNGSYTIEELPGGPVQLFLENSSEKPQFQFRYLVQSKGYIDVPGYYINGTRVNSQRLPDTRLSLIQDAFEVNINGDTELDHALIQGYLTDPFSCPDRERITETHDYDLDPAPDKVRNYKGETAMEYGSGGRTADGHQAVDWGNSNRNVIGIPVRAAAPGIVVFAGEDVTLHGNCRMVTLAHPDTGHKTGYVHLDKILVQDGQVLKRGQILGTLGESCTDWPHLHFTFNPGWNPGDLNWSNKNPYRDTQDPDSYTWWTVDNQPVCSDLSE